MIEAATGSILIPRIGNSLIEYVKDRIKNTTKWRSLFYKHGYNFVETSGSDTASKTLAALDKDAKVVYFVEHTPVDSGLFKGGRQVLVWSSKNRDMPRLAASIFFDYLMPKYHTLVADEEQTAYGAAMWGRAMEEALDSGMHVYLADFQHSPPVLWQVLSDRHLDIINLVRLGSSERHRQMLPVISTRKLSPASAIPQDADMNFLVNTL